MKFGYDPIWFAIIVVIVVEVGLIHPPVGMNLFVIQAQAPDMKITSIYRGIIPFLVAPFAADRAAVPVPRHCAVAAGGALRQLSPEPVSRLAALAFRLGILTARIRGKMQQSDRLTSSRSDEGRYRLLVEAVTDYAIYMLDPAAS